MQEKRNYSWVSLLILLSGVSLWLATCSASGRPVVVWNQTPSVPVGAYLVTTEGRYVALRTTESLQWTAQRGYVAPGATLLKRLVSTDVVCFSEIGMHAAGRLYARLPRDTAGRLMPSPSEGCRLLKPDEWIVAGDHAHSVDSRYFGAIRLEDIAFRAEPLWTF